MEKHIKNGKEHYKGVDISSEFSSELFHVPAYKYEDDHQVALHTNIGSLTVLDRMTGYGGGIRDTETGFRDMDGNFWLASGGYDVRNSGSKTIVEAIQWVKDNANTCIPDLGETNAST